MSTLSVVLSVFNSEKFLEKALVSAQDIAQEIIVVDHNSSDNTVAMAKKFTKKIYQQKNNSQDIDRQKNFGFEKAKGDWILSLDADERITPELVEEIRSIINHQSSVINGYYIPRKNIIFGKWIEHTGWYPDYQLRLFRSGKGMYTKKHVHEHMTIEGQIGKLEQPLIHEAYQSVYQFLHRGLTLYAPNEAENLAENGYIFSFADCIRFPFQEFLSRFFAREGYMDGFHGLVLSLLMAFYHFAVFLYLWEKEKFKNHGEVLHLVSDQLKKSQKDYSYWTKEVQIRSAKNPAAKLLLKAKRKLHV